VDADFQGGWNTETATEDSTTAKSSTANIVIYAAGCPIVWPSKRQTDIPLLTPESEYSALSEATREVLWLMGLLLRQKKEWPQTRL
jgi:hypothetical protein